MPLFRVEDTFAREGIPIDRGTLCRWKKLVGDGLAATVQRHAAARVRHGVLHLDRRYGHLRAGRSTATTRAGNPARKAISSCMIADKDHIFFEYLERETSAKPSASAFVASVAMCKRTPRASSTCSSPTSTQLRAAATTSSLMVARARRWAAGITAESASGKRLSPRAWSGARGWRVLDASSSSMRRGVSKPPSEIKRLRELYLRPHVESFFAWVDEQRPLYQGPARLHAHRARVRAQPARSPHCASSTTAASC